MGQEQLKDLKLFGFGIEGIDSRRNLLTIQDIYPLCSWACYSAFQK